MLAAELRTATRSAGLSLGDRCYLVLARQRGAVALTTEGAWDTVASAAGVTVKAIRRRS